MKFAITVIVTIFLSACANIKISEPTKKDFENSRTYKKDFEATWIRAVDWFADHNVAIDKIEKSSGLLTAKYLISANDTYLDCGDIKATGVLGKPNIEKFGALNLTIREVDKNSSRVNVNFFGEFKLAASDAWDGRTITSSGRCVSTGALEQSVLRYIEGQ